MRPITISLGCADTAAAAAMMMARARISGRVIERSSVRRMLSGRFRPCERTAAGTPLARTSGRRACLMLRIACAVAIAIAAATPVVAPSAAGAQDRPAAGMNREQNAPGSAGPKEHGVVQRGTQPNPAEVRPGNRDGDAPSAAAGELVTKPARRILGFPVDAALLIAGVLIALAVVAGIVIPGARRPERARR